MNFKKNQDGITLLCKIIDEELGLSMQIHWRYIPPSVLKMVKVTYQEKKKRFFSNELR